MRFKKCGFVARLERVCVVWPPPSSLLSSPSLCLLTGLRPPFCLRHSLSSVQLTGSELGVPRPPNSPCVFSRPTLHLSDDALADHTAQRPTPPCQSLSISSPRFPQRPNSGLSPGDCVVTTSLNRQPCCRSREGCPGMEMSGQGGLG